MIFRLNTKSKGNKSKNKDNNTESKPSAKETISKTKGILLNGEEIYANFSLIRQLIFKMGKETHTQLNSKKKNNCI